MLSAAAIATATADAATADAATATAIAAASGAVSGPTGAEKLCTPTQLARFQAAPPCTASADGKWLLFPKAWYPPYDPDNVFSSKSPLSPAACQAFCAANPSCVTWMSDPTTNTAPNCYAFWSVPTYLQGDANWVVGVSADALGP